MLEQRLGRSVSRFTLNGWVQELGERAKSPLEVSIELQPQWGGFLGIDGKVIRVKGDKRCLLIGVDHPTQDLVHTLVLDSETADGFARLATLGPVDPNRRPNISSSHLASNGISLEEIGGGLMDQYSLMARHPTSPHLSSPTRGARSSTKTQGLYEKSVLTLRRAERSPSHEVLQPH